MFGVPRFTDPDHEFNGWARRLAPVACVLLCALVVVMQQFQLSITKPTGTEPPEHLRVSEEVYLPGIESLTLHSKFAVAIKATVGATVGATEDDEVGWDELVEDLELLALTRTDRVRVAVVVWALLGKEEGLRKLDAVTAEVSPGSGLAEDCAKLRKVFRGGTLSAEEAGSLVERHGWFGELASVKKPTSGGAGGGARGGSGGGVFWAESRERASRLHDVSRGLNALNLVLIGVGLLTGFAVLAQVMKGEIESGFESTMLPSGLYIEMFGASALLFLVLVCLQVMTLWMTGPASVAAMVGLEVLMWLELLAVAWPWVRGVRWSVVARDLGLTAGAGVGKEMVAGVVVYLVLMFFSGLSSFAIEFFEAVSGTRDAELPGGGFPPFESPMSGSWAPLVIGTVGAVVLAPILEETFFRGALYRAVRPKLGMWGAVGVTAVVFGAFHPYETSGLVSVGIAGVVFGLAREWRGSLIAPMVAHALYNGTISFGEIATIIAID